MTNYYVYYLTNSLDNQPFYVGKGTGDRMYQHLKESQRDDIKKRSVHRKIQSILKKGGEVLYTKIECETEEAAFAEERRLIAFYGRKDLGLGPLTNLTDGGEGSSNISAESVEARAAKHRGMKRSEESKARMKEAQQKIVERNMELYGCKKNPDSEAKRVAKRTGVPWSENARAVKRNKPTAVPILVYKKDTGEFVGEWSSMNLCSTELSLDLASIWKILTGKLSRAPNGKMHPMKSHKGYTFKYKEQ